MTKVLVISGHDYRSPRRADTHFIADEISQHADVSFFSLGFSSLSRFKGDPRLCLASEANRVVTKNGVKCYLWKTLVHPFRMRSDWLLPVERLHFKMYLSSYPRVLGEWISAADTIIFDSGMSPIFMQLAHRLKPAATIIYNAADDLGTIGCSSYISERLEDAGRYISWTRVPSRTLQDMLPAGSRVFYIPHGIDPSISETADPSPYGTGLHAVSVGSMLFDASFFDMAARAFPDITFHVIGPGRAAPGLARSNVRVYGEMQFRDTLRFVKHAAFGVAPYREDGSPAYLADTSMKLQQYRFFCIPAVCPVFAAGADPFRFGYQPGDETSIAAAISSALHAGRAPPGTFLSWRDVAQRLLAPTSFKDTLQSA
jgi:2-beta-glucuronyltransferase